MTNEEAVKIIDNIIFEAEKIESFKITDWYYIDVIKEFKDKHNWEYKYNLKLFK
jgi:hypothetical protein